MGWPWGRNKIRSFLITHLSCEQGGSNSSTNELSCLSWSGGGQSNPLATGAGYTPRVDVGLGTCQKQIHLTQTVAHFHTWVNPTNTELLSAFSASSQRHDTEKEFLYLRLTHQGTLVSSVTCPWILHPDRLRTSHSPSWQLQQQHI